MSLSLHYCGRLAEIEYIKDICDELASIAERMSWPCGRLDEDWSQRADAAIEVTQKSSQIAGHLPLKGIALTTHPKCETLKFFFDVNGHLRDPMSMVDRREDSLKPEDYWISVKTQFAGPEIHVWIVGLLKYLKKHYLPDLEVHDEGEYWDTGNFEILNKKMDFVFEKISAVRAELSRISKGHIERYSADEFATMIEALLRHKFDIEDSIN